jgi:cytochrome c-type biogenesis protein CcmH
MIGQSGATAIDATERNALPSKKFAVNGHVSRSRAAPALLIAMILVFQSAAAQTTDANLDAKVKALSAELRCLVCQNQSVADSDAPVARDMREQVRAQLAAGKSEAQVKQYMTERFGDFVLYKPAFNASTIVLWVAPFIALFGAAFFLIRRVGNAQRQQIVTAASPDDATSEADRERARKLLSD